MLPQPTIKMRDFIYGGRSGFRRSARWRKPASTESRLRSQKLLTTPASSSLFRGTSAFGGLHQDTDGENFGRLAHKIITLCRGAIKTGKVCAIKIGILQVTDGICLRDRPVGIETLFASAEDRALRGRNLSAV
jgi:hypothetical protein